MYLWSVSSEHNKKSMKEGMSSVFVLCCLPSLGKHEVKGWRRPPPRGAGAQNWGGQNSGPLTNSYLLYNQVLFTGFSVWSVILCDLGEGGSRKNIIFPQGRSWTSPSLWISSGSQYNDFVILKFHDLNAPFSPTVNPLLLEKWISQFYIEFGNDELYWWYISYIYVNKTHMYVYIHIYANIR